MNIDLMKLKMQRWVVHRRKRSRKRKKKQKKQKRGKKKKKKRKRTEVWLLELSAGEFGTLVVTL